MNPRCIVAPSRLALVAGITLAVACGGPQQGAEPSATADAGLTVAQQVFASTDPKAAYEALGAEDRAQFDAATTPVDGAATGEELTDENGNAISPSTVVQPHYSGCYYVHATGKVTAKAGNTLYTFWQNTTVCVSSGRVTSVKVTDADGETKTPGWRIDKDPTTSTKNVGWEGRGKARYYFVLGVGGWDISHPTDCLQQRLNANGKDHTVSLSCDIG